MGMRFRSRQTPRTTQDQAAAITALKKQTVLTDKPYHSSTYYDWVRTGGGPYTYTLAAGERKAFSYKIGDVPTLGGFRAGFGAATEAETNLINANNTNGGEFVIVRGLRLILEPDSDVRLAALMWPNISVLAKFQTGEIAWKFGNLSMIPGGGGLYGGGNDSVGIQPLGGGRPQFNVASNGHAAFNNYFPLRHGFVWNPASAGRDTTFELSFNVQRAVVVTAPADEAAIAQIATVAGVRGYAAPADGVFGTYVKIKAVLVGETRVNRSNIQ
jgi:hypothetical protein